MEPLLVISNALQEIVVMNIEFEKYAQGEKFIVEAEAHDCITPENKLDWTWWDNVTNNTSVHHFVWIVFKKSLKTPCRKQQRNEL